MRSAALLAPLLIAVLTVASLPRGAAGAPDVEVAISAPEEARVGEDVQIQVTLRSTSDGAPIANAEVTLGREASFAGVTGDVRLARATTDEEGVALLIFEPRATGEQELTVEYEVPDAGEPETATVTIVAQGEPQLHRSTAGIQVPGLNVWLLIAVLSVVWGILFTTAVFMLRVARAGAEATAASPGAAGHTGHTGGKESPFP